MSGRTDISCRFITEQDVAGTVRLMTRIGVHFGGSKRTSVLTAIAREGITHPEQTLIAVAEQSGAMRALVIAFALAPRRYWPRFAARHPVEGAAIAAHRVRRIFERRFLNSSGGIRPRVDVAETDVLVRDRVEARGQQRWSDDSARIAKVMYVASDPDHRGGGLGSTIYSWFFRSLARRNFSRCDAQVSDGNVGAVMLHKRFPFHFIRSEGGYFLWLLPSEVAS